MPHTNFEDHQDLTHLSIHPFEFDIFHWPNEGVISSGEGVNLKSLWVKKCQHLLRAPTIRSYKQVDPM